MQDAVFLLLGCCDPFNDKALRASRGASFRVPLFTVTWDKLLPIAEGLKMPLFSGDPSAPDPGLQTEESHFEVGVDRVAEVASAQKLCLVLGTEGQGLSDVAKEKCQPVSIPMHGEMESLNVGVAGGILMYLLM